MSFLVEKKKKNGHLKRISTAGKDSQLGFFHVRAVPHLLKKKKSQLC